MTFVRIRLGTRSPQPTIMETLDRRILERGGKVDPPTACENIGHIDRVIRLG